MQIENSSQIGFGHVTSSIPLSHFKANKVQKILKCYQAQLDNPVLTDLFINNEGEMAANIFISKPYYQYDKTFSRGFLQTKHGFIKKMCKIADKINYECECAQMRFEMFENKLYKPNENK